MFHALSAENIENHGANSVEEIANTEAPPKRIFQSELTHCGLGDFNEILVEYISGQLQGLKAETPPVKLPSEECL